jgi:hypothetical protein
VYGGWLDFENNAIDSGSKRLPGAFSIIEPAEQDGLDPRCHSLDLLDQVRRRPADFGIENDNVRLLVVEYLVKIACVSSPQFIRRKALQGFGLQGLVTLHSWDEQNVQDCARVLLRVSQLVIFLGSHVEDH